MKSKLAFVFLLAITLPAAAMAQDATPQVPNMVSGNQLHMWCQANDTTLPSFNPVSASFCAGYIEGVVDFAFNTDYLINRLRTTKYNGPFCYVGDVSGQQVIDTVKRYLAEHPAERGGGASGLIYAALQEAFPCRVTSSN